jgi:hypothetical protein
MTSGERLLVELNVSVRFLTEAFGKFQTVVEDQIRGLTASTIGRKEFDLTKIDSDRIHADHSLRIERNEKDIEDLKTGAATLAGQIRVWGFIITSAIGLLGCAIAYLAIIKS